MEETKREGDRKEGGVMMRGKKHTDNWLALLQWMQVSQPTYLPYCKYFMPEI